MNSRLLFCFLLFFIFQAKAQTTGEVIDSFFEALNTKNYKVLDQFCVEDMNIHSLAIGAEKKLTTQSKEDFLNGIRSIPKETKIFEKIESKDSFVTENLAQYMLPYSFYVDDKFSHSGTNVITLIKINEGWKISYIADTRKK